MLIAASEYESMLETAYLLSTPANREWLLESMAQADRGEFTAVEFPLTASAQKNKGKKKSRSLCQLRPVVMRALSTNAITSLVGSASFSAP